MKRALIIVDVQNDFVTGSLAVDGASDSGLIEDIQTAAKEGGFDLFVGTRDWHPREHFSFSREPEFKDGSWPSHCVAFTPGADYAPGIGDLVGVHYLKAWERDKEDYSGFAGIEAKGDPRSLADRLKDEGIEEVVVVGLALDYCVKATALDALAHGFTTLVIPPLTRAVSLEGGRAAVNELIEAGVQVRSFDRADVIA